MRHQCVIKGSSDVLCILAPERVFTCEELSQPRLATEVLMTDHLGLALSTARRRLCLLLRLAQGGCLDGVVGVLCRPRARARITGHRGCAPLLMRDAITLMRNAITLMRDAIRGHSACNSTHLFLSQSR